MAKKRRRKYKRRKFKFKLRLNRKVIWTVAFSLFTIVLIVGAIYAIYTLETFRVKEENISSNLPLTRSLKKDIAGQSLFTLDIESISSRLLEDYPGYKKVYVIKKFPSSLIIDAKKRGSFAQLKAKKFYPLDQEAVVLSDGKFQFYKSLIPIEINGRDRSFKKGDVVKDKRLKYAFDLIYALEETGFLSKYKVKLINATNLAATYFLIDRAALATDQKLSNKDIEIIIGDRDFKSRLNTLNDVINQTVQDKIGLVDYIDLRYKKTYLSFLR